MFLSTGGTNISVPINSAVGIGETKVLQANLASNLSSATLVSGVSNTVYDTIGTGDWKFYVGPSTSTAAITAASASTEWTGGSLLSYLEDYYVLYYNFDTTLVSGSNVYNTGSKSYDATLVNATVVATSPSPSVFGTDRGYLVCSAANYLQINGTYITGLTGTSIATWINVNGTGGDIFKSSDGAQSSIQLYVSSGTSIVLSITNNADSFSTTLYTNAAVNNGSWHHVVLVMTPVSALSTPITNSSGNSGLAGGVARWQLFFDGTSVYDQISPTVNCKYPDYIVRGTNKIGPITALIDDFRVYDMALTTADIAVLNSRFSSWYKFNSATGNNTIDSINGNTAVLSGGASIQTATPSPVGGGYVSLSSALQQYITIPQFAVGSTSVGHSFFFKTELSNAHKILTSFSISQLNKYITFGIVGNSVYLNMNLTNGIAYAAGGGTFQGGFTTFSNLTSNTGGDIAVSVDDKIMVTHTGFNASVAQSILVSNFSGSTWGVPTSIGSMTKLWNLAMTSDGKRIVATQKGGYVFVSTWNGTSYSAFVQTSDATSRTYTGLGMTADGSRIVCCTNETGPSGNVYMALWNEATNNYNAFTTIVTGISTSIGYDTMCISVDGYKIAYSSGTTGYWASWNGSAYVQQTSFTCVTALNMKFTIDANILLMTTNSAVSAIYSVFFNGTTFSTLTAYGGTTAILNKNLLGFHVNVSSYFYLSENGVIGGPYRNRVYWGTTYRTYRCNTITDNNWHNIYFNFYSPYFFEYWFDGTNLTATDVLILVDPNFGAFYANNTITTNYVGRSLNSPLTFFDGSIDDLRFYNRRLSTAEASFLITGKMNIPQITAGASGPTWMPTPATLVDSTETNYTIKSNEIALIPGANSTYAVWTAPKSTNIKVDVSFADYNSRNVGVGFQMFKINNDNTFGSVIYPRTVTSVALTNANPNNYLSVPSKTISVATGDKVYYRIDANGNTTAASSVLSTNIYVDPNPDLKQPNLLQAHLGNNMAATTFVSGNANVVSDTRGTGSWKFYAANSNSIASVTGSSNSTEWTGGSLLSYTAADYSLFYPFNTNTVSGSTVLNMATNAYDLTLYGGASIINTVPSPASQPPSTGSGYLQMNTGTGQYAQATQLFSLNPAGSTISLWFRWTSNVSNAPIFSYDDGTNYVIFYMWGESWCNIHFKVGGGVANGWYSFNRSEQGITVGNWVNLTFLTATGQSFVNGVLSLQPNGPGPTAFTQPTKFYLGNSSASPSFIMDGRDFVTKTGTIDIDNFVIYNKTLTATEIMSLYAKSDLYYPMNVPDINPGNPLQVGDLASGSYLYSGTLVGGATIAVDVGSRVAGQGYLKATSTAHKMSLPPVSTGANGLSFALWFKMTTNRQNVSLFDFNDGGDANNQICVQTAYTNETLGTGPRFYTIVGGSGYGDIYVGSFSEWTHFVFVLTPPGNFTTYVNGSLHRAITGFNYPISKTRANHSVLDWKGSTQVNNAGVDDFRFYNRAITVAEISYLYNGPPQPTLKDDTTGVAWMPIPATPVISSETSYTVKSNEVALKPGTNSTFAVWTATKFTNLKIDVSFADYHTRSAGVGFQMFKIKSDNTFDSVLFPRTVTTAALTNAAPNNYLPVPTVSTTVAAGDKIYLRVDANGNTTAASSILATTIFTDAISVANNPVENRLLQAHLGNNLNATTFVSGNSNTVLDTAGTSNWQFYVAPSASVAAITSSSASSEWTDGTALSANDAFAGTLLFGATYVADAGSRVSGKNYLKLPNSTGAAKCASISPFIPTTNGISFSFWIRHTTIVNNNTVFFFNFRDANSVNETNMGNFWFGAPSFLGVFNNTGSVVSTGIPFSSVADGNWHHIAWTMTYSVSTTSTWKFYLDGVVSAGTTLTNRSYMNLVTRTYHNIGNYGDQGDITFAVNGGVDNFRVYHKVLSDAEVLADVADNSNLPTQLSDSISQSPVWKLKPAIAVDSTETSYTVKNNEIALTPGTNSTYAVWTSPKTTNIKVDVSFADYHTRSSAGVGFQMFKINADNTFGSVIYPRTVTSVALTNAAPNNYLSVPSRTVSVTTGDKLYYRVDANGNTTAASSVLATTIYIDPNQDLKQYNVLQANLGNNMAATSFVSGNANVVNDTRGTGSWKLYVAGNTSVAAITGTSASSEWTVGNLLSYDPGSPIILNYSFDTTTQSGNTIKNLATNDYGLTLMNGATIATASPAPYSTENAGYLSMNMSSGQYATSSVPLSFSSPWTISFWHKFSGSYINDPTVFEIGNTNGFGLRISTGSSWKTINSYKNGTQFDGYYYANNSDTNWNHYALVYQEGLGYTGYYNATTGSNFNGFPVLNVVSDFTYMNFGRSNMSSVTNLNTGTGTIQIDKFQIFNTRLHLSDITALYNGTYIAPINATLKDAASGVAWKPVPGSVVDPSETNYTIKSNEIALRPGANSTFAVWTATKSTNVKVDVSFADYHTRSAGVGFQMFKIKSDNTFDSVLFPRTVTTAALTNAAPNNYLSVPSVTTSMNNGDKIYLRIDANGNTTAASSVLATNIYTDAVSIATNPAETRVLQAHLGNNLNATTFVSGNANVVYDTIGNGDWKFYVAGNTSVASISSTSASSEWTAGNLLSYSAAADYSVFYPFNTNTVSGSTVLNMATNAYDLTLYNGASIINTVPFPSSQPSATGSGYLSMNVGAGQYGQLTQSYSFNSSGSTISFWVRWTSNVSVAPIFSYGTAATSLFLILLVNSTSIQTSVKNGASQTNTNIKNYVSQPNQVYITLLTKTGGVYLDGVFEGIAFPLFVAGVQPNYFYFGNYNPAINGIGGFTYNMSGKTGTIDIDNFVVYNKTLTETEIMSLYAKSDLYYPFDVADINPGNPLQVGDVSTGPYVYNGTLVNGATIAVDSGSRIAGQGYLKLVSASGHTMNTGPFNVTTSGLSFSLWFRATSSTNFGRIIFSNDPYIFISVYFADLYMGISNLDDVSVGEAYLDNVWRHSVFTIQYGGVGGASSVYKIYVNGVLRRTFTQPYPALGIRTSSTMGDSMDGGIDDFRIYHRVITDAEISYLYNGPPQVTLKDDATGVAWMPIPGTPVDASETLYTIKSNEIALTPGTNSTYAVWTAPKSTNIRVDVSFADYHSRTAGVGFQMFKINNDNTFGSTIFPRTVTSTALTNAAPNNYLNVPSVSLSVSTGDMVYYRIDANGNTTSASSVISTNIYSYSGKWN